MAAALPPPERSDRSGLRRGGPRGSRNPERDEEITRMFADGWAKSAIARRFGISRQRVDQIGNPRITDARRAVKYALETGALVRADTCQDCGATDRIEAHHPDYSKPLEVEWLCTKCHTARHPTPARPRRMRRRVVRECVQCGEAMRLVPGSSRKHCSKPCALKTTHERAATMAIGEADLLAEMKRVAAIVGHTPTQSELLEHGKHSHTSFYKYFGSLRAAAARAGLKPRPPGHHGHRHPRKATPRKATPKAPRKKRGPRGKWTPERYHEEVGRLGRRISSLQGIASLLVSECRERHDVRLPGPVPDIDSEEWRSA